MFRISNKETVPGQASTIGRNFVWLLVSGFVSISNSIFLWIVIARTRDVEEVGRFALVMGIYALFITASSLGLVPHFVSEISRRRAAGADAIRQVEKYLNSAGAFMAAAGVVAAAAMAATGYLSTGSPDARNAAFVLSIAMLPTGLIALAEASMIAAGRARVIALITTVENVVRTVVPVIMIIEGFGLVAICASFVLVRWLALACYTFLGRHLILPASINIADMRIIALVLPTFAGTAILSAVLWQAPAVMLAGLSTESETALYGTASRFMIAVSIILASYAGVLQPHLTAYASRGPEFVARHLMCLAWLPLLIAAAIALIAPFCAGDVLQALFGANYTAASSALSLFAVCIVPYTLIMIASRGLISMGAQRVDLLANLAGVIALFLTGILLVPEFGAAGATMSQLVGFILMALIEVGVVIWMARRSLVTRSERTLAMAAGPR